LPGKTRLRNDLLSVDWGAKPYTLAQTHITGLCNLEHQLKQSIPSWITCTIITAAIY